MPLGVLRGPQLLIVQHIFAEPRPQLVMVQPKADEEETDAAHVGVVNVVNQPTELPLVNVHGEQAVEAAEQRRRRGVAVLHVGLDVVSELVHFLDKLLERLQREQRLEVCGLHDVGLKQGAEAKGLGVSYLERAFPVPVVVAALPSGLGSSWLYSGALVFFAFDELLIALTELAVVLRPLVQVAPQLLGLLVVSCLRPHFLLPPLLCKPGLIVSGRCLGCLLL
mmetsp:Transcript_1613/g.5497  ORF Transcript_1613/g.5497 Transcript_1613/m.5497 type:complete len:223 (+) Transcript_1613:918-1586(+)